jgi:hypothetical protein
MQVLVLAGVACLLVGRSQAGKAGKNAGAKARKACLPEAAKRLTGLVVPDDVKPLASLSRTIYPNNLFEGLRNDESEAYMALMMARKWPSSCEGFSKIVDDQLTEACGEGVAMTLGEDLWAFGEKVQDVLTAAYSCDVASGKFRSKYEWWNGVECLSIVSGVFVDSSSVIPDDVKELIEDAREIRQRLLGSTAMVANNKKYIKAMEGKYVQGCDDFKSQMKEELSKHETCYWFINDLQIKRSSIKVLISHEPDTEATVEALHVCLTAPDPKKPKKPKGFMGRLGSLLPVRSRKASKE